MTPDNSPAPFMPQFVDGEILTQLATLNSRGLQVLCEAPGLDWPLAAEARATLDGAVLKRMADAPYLLFEIDVEAALGGGAGVVTRRSPSVADATPHYSIWSDTTGRVFAAAMLQFAWHVARTRPAAAPLVLGLPAEACAALRVGEFRGLDWVAAHAARWVALRWAYDLAHWAQRLRAAAAGDLRALRSNTLAGLQRLAGRGLRR